MSEQERDRILLDLVKEFDQVKHDWQLLSSDLDRVATAYRKAGEHMQDVLGRTCKGTSTSPPEETDVRHYPDVLKMLAEHERLEHRAFELSVQLRNLGHDVTFPPR